MTDTRWTGPLATVFRTAATGAIFGFALMLVEPVSAASLGQSQAQAQLPPGHAAPQGELANWVQRNGFACKSPEFMRKARPAAPGWFTYNILCESGWYRVTYANNNRVFAEPM